MLSSAISPSLSPPSPSLFFQWMKKSELMIVGAGENSALFAVIAACLAQWVGTSAFASSIGTVLLMHPSPLQPSPICCGLEGPGYPLLVSLSLGEARIFPSS